MLPQYFSTNKKTKKANKKFLFLFQPIAQTNLKWFELKREYFFWHFIFENLSVGDLLRTFLFEQSTLTFELLYIFPQLDNSGATRRGTRGGFPP